MAEFGLMRNCEGYMDTTYGRAALNILPKPGDIWIDRKGYSKLIIKHFGQHSMCLMLKDDDRLPYPVGGLRCNPAMMTFVFDSDLLSVQETITADELSALIYAVSDALSLPTVQTDSNDAELTAVQGALEQTKAALANTRRQQEELRAELEQVSHEADRYKAMYDNIIDKLIGRLVG